MKSARSKNYFIIVLFASLLFVGVILYSNINLDFFNTKTDIRTKFNKLSYNGNVACFGPDAIYSKSDSERLQGSCCSPMIFHKYEEQIEGLKKYSYIDKIPSDPYDIPVDLAKQLLDYDKAISLSSDEQRIYNTAMKMSDEGGPCCCRCWRWYVYEGLAKYLITEYNFTADQIAEVWNLSDGCGGEDHL